MESRLRCPSRARPDRTESDVLARFLRGLHKAEDIVLAALIGALLLIAVGQIVLRLGFSAGVVWIEPVARMGVLWLALLGALGAARQHRHIAIDALPLALPPRLRRIAWRITQLGASGVSGVLAWFAWQLLLLEREIAASFIPGLPSWVPMLVLPLGFGLMAVRLLLAGLQAPPMTAAAVPEPAR